MLFRSLGVARGSSAESAGFKGVQVRRDGTVLPGDIIVSVEGKAVDTPGKLRALLDDYKVGDRVRIGVLRGKAKIEITTTLQAGS